MKLMGCILILTSACGAYLSYRRSLLSLQRMAEKLAEDLALLRCGICIHRRTLFAILSDDLAQERSATEFWSALSRLLVDSDESVRSCWEEAAGGLPTPFDTVLTPLGALLPAGGDVLANAIEEARSDLLRYVRTHRDGQSTKLRLAAAMCFSVALLFVLVCV